MILERQVVQDLCVNRHAKGTPDRHPKGTPFVADCMKPRCFFVWLGAFLCPGLIIPRVARAAAVKHDTGGEFGGQRDQATACRAANREIRVRAE